jgi:hypothetical protein
MAGLNDLVTDKTVETTTLPNWYSQAQQQTVGKAMAAESPTVGQTAAQSAINAFGTGSPFAAGQDILQNIGSGAANPWLVSTDATGAQTVTPNVNTALGGLYQSQRDYLNEIMPDLDAATTARSIAGGDFGSRMNLSGIANARANAFADLAQKQMQSALQAQQTGVSAGAGLGNIGNQLVQSAINTGTYQQNAPYATPMNLANVISKLNVPTTMTKSSELGGLNQILGLLSLTEGGLSSILGGTKTVGGKQVSTPGLIQQIQGLYGRLTGANRPELSGVEQIFNPAAPGQEGYGWQYFSDGTVIDPSGQYYQDGEMIWSPFWDESYYNSGGSGLDLGGGNVDWLDEFDWDALAAGQNPYSDYDNWDLY